ncbi:WXG100 family type VII secretion target [Labedaea rhizosphaerae]|uniref:PPE family protein n=1 Tax=Labedaea rhizosphaerae TaxID=598644 RepID=A0A4R6SPR5_LABRH|nr:PPE domain-containing protein [Labedaea rhizosphaerae]TDQ05492.1 PPE family protein [Labedaea rhizosphaerae]
MANHHGKTYTAVHGVSKRQQREQAHTHRLQQQQYKHFGKVNWDYFSHRQMWDMVQSAKPQQMYDKADDWSNLATAIDSTTRGVQGTMQKLMTTWRGSAAVSASESNSRLTQWGGEAGNTAVAIGTGLKHYADAVTHAQATMPEPVDYVAERRLAEGYAVNVTDPELHSYLLKHLADDHMATQEQAKTAKAKAIQVMSGYEDRSYEVHDKLPEFQQAPSMAPRGGTATVPVASPPGGGSQTQPPNVAPPGSGGGTTATSPGAGDGSGTNPGYTTPSFAQPPNVGGGTGYPGSGYPGGGGYPGGVGPGLPGGGGSGTNYPGQGFGGVGGAGGPGAAGFGGRPVGIGGAGAAGEGAAGARSGVGALGGAAAAEEAAATRGAAGAAGRGGAGGMYPPMGGSGANREDDGEHHNKYDDGLDLFDDIPPAYPAVFGE